jgi:hypothetical protein
VSSFKLKAHITALCERHKLEHRLIPAAAAAEAKGVYPDRCIYAPAVTCPLAYAIALHEIGHFVVASRRGDLLDEATVWAWVRDTALVWTPQFDALVAKTLTICAEKTNQDKLVETLFEDVS